MSTRARVLLLFAALLPACGRGGEGPLVMAGVAAVEGHQVRLISEPSPIPLNEPFELVVELLDSRGQPAEEVGLEVTGWMPGHGHGMLRTTEVVPIGGGIHRVRGMLFHMGGKWEIRVALSWEEQSEDYFEIKRDGIVFPVEL